MESNDGAAELRERIPRLAPGWEPQDVALTPAEGFLLSRMDGRTSWLMLRQIGGVTPEQVDDFLERWVETGAIELVDLEPLTTQADDEPIDVEAEIDPSLEIDEPFQRRILDYEIRLSGSYHELLGVSRGADSVAIKKAYFSLSKEFHPDRYFRKKIGAFAPRLERVFRKLVEAYELLSDPATRAEVERSMESAPPEEQAGAYRVKGGTRDAMGKPPRGYAKPTPMQNLERLRRRFRIPKKLLAERQFKARQLFQAAQVAAHQKRWIEASASVRLAIAFDPWNPDYKDGFARIQQNVHGLRAIELLEQAESAGSRIDSMRLVDEALGYRPMDPELNVRAAKLAIQVDEIERAREFAETAIEVEPDSAVNHALLARALRRLGRYPEAERALDKAAHLDPNAPEVRAERLRANQRMRRL